MYGQMTAGSWIYIGTQGILQGTYETLGSLAHQRGWPSLKGKFVLTAGLGGMGGAQPLAITMNEGVGLIVEVDPARAHRRQEIGYVDVVVDTLEEAMTLVEEACRNEKPKSIGLIGNAAEIYPELVTARRDPRCGHRPNPRPRCADVCSHLGLSVRRPKPCAAATRRNMSGNRCSPWPATWRPCWLSSAPAPRSSITATTCASGLMIMA